MKDMLYKDVGERIMCTRAMRGYTRDSLAELAQITPKFLYEIENGKKGFSVWVLYNLSKALNVDCDYILTGKHSMEHDQKLMEVLGLFEANQAEGITNILKDIYAIL